MKKKLFVLSSVFLGLAPLAAFAQGIIPSGNTSNGCVLGSNTLNATLFGILCRIGQFLNSIVPVLVALGLVYFIYGVVSYVIASDEEAKKAGRDRIIFGIIGLAVIIGVWGLVALLRNTLQIGNAANVELPTVPVVLPNTPQ